MGDYLSTPNLEKHSEDGENGKVFENNFNEFNY
jgi:hypothetical protein